MKHCFDLINNIDKELPLTYALDASGKMVCINDVKRGLECNCRCPKCNALLEAKLGYGGRIAHFAHSKESVCHGAYMSALHKLAEQIIEEEKAVMAPAYMSFDKRKLIFSKVEVEKRNDRKDLQPDIVGVTNDNLRWAIEIRNTNEIKDNKKVKLKESDITCLEIDVREQVLEELKSFLLDSTKNREWIYNSNYDKIIRYEKTRQSSTNYGTLIECFCSLNDYYCYLKRTGEFEIEKGRNARILECDMVGDNTVLLLLKDINEFKAFYQYHIKTIDSVGEELYQKLLADFVDEKSARNVYFEKLSFLNKQASLWLIG